MNNYNIGDIYQEMEIYLIKSMKRNLSKHLKEEAKYGFDWTQWQVEKLKEIKRFQRENSEIIGNYQNRITKEVSSQLKSQFKEGTKQAQKHFKKAVKNGYKYDGRMNKSFFAINDRKVKSLINSVNNDLKTANTATLRMINDQYRKIIHKATMFASNGVLTKTQAIDMATKDFLSRGLNSIEYSNGARVNIASYAKMAVNTAHQRAQLQGEGEFRKKIGNPLIKITKHGTPCKLCQKWEGRVLIDDVYSGGNKNDGKYPLLSQAMNQGLYHPNCKHGVATYYPELSDIEFDENGPTEETLKNYQEDLNYCNLQINRFNRLSVGSLDEENIKKYSSKKEQWELAKKKIENNSKIIDKLSKEEKYAITSYLSSDSYIINNALMNDFHLDERLTKVVDDLSSALEKIPNTSGTFNRSLFFYDEVGKKEFINSLDSDPIIFKGFTSMAKDIYDENDDVRLIMHVTKGKDISVLNPREQEVMLNKNAKFKFLKKYEKDDKIFIELEEIE